LQETLGPKGEYFGLALTTGSAGTIGSGDYLKQLFPGSKVAAGEALQCPTLLENGYGGHRIEGIGDKHVPWIHNVKNTDMLIAIDDNDVVNLARLFNEPAGRKYLVEQGVPEDLVGQLDLLGFSSIANTLMSIKMAKYYELNENDVILTVWTDSMELYKSRLAEMHEKFGEYSEIDAAVHYARDLKGVSIDHLQELTYEDRRRVHNLKYFTWIEQQGKTYEEILEQWYNDDYWTDFQKQLPEMDELIEEFNAKVGLI
ncbi:MAG: pyridoxal-5-phosphate-dependent protein subunit beta, partial [Chloroflexota bacterium]|nr:pyridoxal-5-phosphate-dependent protein subunit beta [Chloroflexota bacterium]